MLASLADSTIKQYSVTYKIWWDFCKRKNLDIFSASIPSLMLFLSEQFDRGSSYSTLNTHRSALSLLLGSNIGSDDSIKRLLKGVFKLRPCLPKYTSTWDPQIVLNEISNWFPNKELSLEKITKKLAILLALCTAHRVQTISLIRTKNINITNDGIKIVITDIIKTSAPGRDQPVLFLPYFKDKPNICPATALEDYLVMTKTNRSKNIQNLFVTFRRPYKTASTQSISRWIKDVLQSSGVDVAVFGAHSTRHAATSAARANGVPIDVIRKKAGWTNSSQIFAKFYNRPLLTNDNFARSTLLPKSYC